MINQPNSSQLNPEEKNFRHKPADKSFIKMTSLPDFRHNPDNLGVILNFLFSQQ